MRPSARLQSAIDLLDEIIIAARDGGPSADALASRFFAARRYAGSKDRRAIRDLAWLAIRRFGECPPNGRSAFVTLAREDGDIAALFDGSGYGPPHIGDGEEGASGDIIPHWILPLISDLVDDDECRALLDRGPLDLRVNALKAGRDGVLAQLEGAVALDSSNNAVRLPTGTAIDKHDIILSGLAEIQDLGSQIICDACHVDGGMTVLDLCAGAGGKTLALAAAMNGQGVLVASDSNRNRLGQLTPRAQRAGAGHIQTILLNPGKEAEMLSNFTGKCDLALIDAPCSGSGTWRRNPETRWRLTPERLQRVMDEQARLLAIGAEMVAPDGHLVYAVCSLLYGEGREQVDRFLKSHENWRPVDAGVRAGRAWGDGVLLTPAHDGSDGFFLARLQKLC